MFHVPAHKQNDSAKRAAQITTAKRTRGHITPTYTFITINGRPTYVFAGYINTKGTK